MAFKPQNLTLTSPINASGPKYFLYLTTDTAAVTTAATYFRLFADSNNQSLLPIAFSVGDVINCNCSDGFATVSISSISPITTTFEATDLGPNSVDTAAIQDLAVTSAKLAANSVIAGKIAAGTIVNADINAAAAIAFSKLAALASGNILVGSAGTVPTSVAMSGDVAIIASGATTIQADAITTAKILNANVTLAKLSAGITPSHVIKFAGQPTTVGGAAAEAFAIPGVLATDLAFVQIIDDGGANVTVLQAVCTVDTLTVTFSANPGNDTIFNYQIIRAAA